MRWGFEHLQLDQARVKELGAENLFHSIDVTWDNHEGDGYVTFQQWDGAKWNVVSDRIAPDWALLRPIIEKLAEAYAAEKGLPIRTQADADEVVTNWSGVGGGEPPPPDRQREQAVDERRHSSQLRARRSRLQRRDRRPALR